MTMKQGGKDEVNTLHGVIFLSCWVHQCPFLLVMEQSSGPRHVHHHHHLTITHGFLFWD